MIILYEYIHIKKEVSLPHPVCTAALAAETNL
jgi:hypothetical protein